MKDKIFKLNRLFIFVLMPLCVSACQSTDPAELELLKRDDPGFRNLMAVQDEMELRIRDLKKEIADQEAAADSKISQIKNQLESETDVRKKMIEQIESELKDTRSNFAEDVERTAETLQAKEELVKNLSSALEHAKSILDQAETLGLTDLEIKDWQNRITALTERFSATSAEVANLQDQTSLKRRKLKYL